jgi:hypothetical protein
MFGYWSLVTARAGLDFDLYHATKHYGVWFMWTKLGMSNRAIAAQAGWSWDGGQDAARCTGTGMWGVGRGRRGVRA